MMTDTTIMPFGKYKGEALVNVPSEYLLWLFDNGKCFGALRQYIIDNKEGLRKEVCKNNHHGK